MKNYCKSALIIGVSGQDGSYLSRLLISKRYKIWGTSRNVEGTEFLNLKALNIKDNVSLLSMDIEEFEGVYSVLSSLMPDEIYFLGGESSVASSFEKPAKSIQSIVTGSLNILEACRLIQKEFKVYFAGSSECFGDTGNVLAIESTPFNPKSPYGVAKVSSFWLVKNYRESYKMKVCTGILFNHESPLRPQKFVTQKIISTAKRIFKGSNEKLELGRLDISRDWGWAPDYVNAMWLMLQQDEYEDFIISTGEVNSLESFVEEVFSFFNLDWKEHTKFNNKFLRPNDINFNGGNPKKAEEKLNWKHNLKMKQVIELMIKSKL
jgi:GDPmannose 4,6-dehydratase